MSVNQPKPSNSFKWQPIEIKSNPHTPQKPISTIHFNQTGDLLGVGDEGGLITIYKSSESKTYKQFSSFAGHESRFDYLKSLEIEPKVKGLCWLRQPNANHFLLTANESSIKLWKLGESGRVSQRKVFEKGHLFHIHSISANPDVETFMSADDVKINVWNQEISDKSFNIVDWLPSNLINIVEVITCALFHPSASNIFVYGSSAGLVRLCDMRTNALCDRHAKIYGNETAEVGFLNQVMTSITDVKFSGDGRRIIVRNPFTIKIWDLAYEKEPLSVYSVDDSLPSKSILLYDRGCLFDKFQVGVSPDDRCGIHSGVGRFLLSGTYGECFRIFETGGSQWHLDMNGDTVEVEGSSDCSFSRKIINCAWHPSDNTIALANGSQLLMYRSVY